MTMIKGIWKSKLVTRTLESLRILLVLSFAILCLGCLAPTRAEINATIWLNNLPLPHDLCAVNPELENYGIYRKLNNGKLEFVSVCTPEIKNWLSIHQDDLNKLLDKYVPNK